MITAVVSLALIIVLVILFCVVKFSREEIRNLENKVEHNKQIFNDAQEAANKMRDFDIEKLVKAHKEQIKNLTKKYDGIKSIKVFKPLPLEVGKTYTSKMATKSKFTVTKIELNKQGQQERIEGVHEGSEHLGSCPWYPERLIHEVEEVGVKDVCACCEFPINEKYVVGKKR